MSCGAHRTDRDSASLLLSALLRAMFTTYPAAERRWLVACDDAATEASVDGCLKPCASPTAPDPVARRRTPDGVSDGLPTTPPGRRPGGARRRAGRPDASPTPPDAAPRTEPDGGRTGSRPVPDKLPARRTERRVGGHSQVQVQFGFSSGSVGSHRSSQSVFAAGPKLLPSEP